MREQYIIDEKGKKVAAVIPIKDFERLIEKLEELDDIRLIEEAKEEGGESIPFDEAVIQIEAKRKAK